ncbi:hypothetical protein BC628DRAFT_1316681, partial [Trametes gibbosa]
VGVADVSGIDQSPLAEGEERCKASLSQFLREQFHGHWYPDATVVTVAAVATHVLTRFHFGWAWYLIILAFCHSHYSASMRRFRAHASDDILRQLVKRRLAHRAPKIESVEWLNKLLDRLWLVYEPNFSRTVGALVDRVLQQHCPESLDSVRLSTFSLGSKAPRIDTAETCAHVEDDVVTLVLGFSFAPYDTSELTGRKKQNLVKPSVVVNARSGRHPGRSFFLDNICFRGHLEIHFKCAPIISPEMMISAVGHSFVEKPALDYVLKPVHGELFETLDTVNVGCSFVLLRLAASMY